MAPPVLFSLALLLIGSSQATILLNTAFPFEGCKQVPKTNAYNATMVSYREWDGGSQLCYDFQATDMDSCTRRNQVSEEDTAQRDRCCDTIMTKMKFWPNQKCWGSLRRVFTQAAGGEWYSHSFTAQTMPGKTVKAFTKKGMKKSWTKKQNNNKKRDQFVVKTTGIYWDRSQYDGGRICIQLGGDCPNLTTFAFDGKNLEWLLYDEKVDEYECCVPGYTKVVEGNFGTYRLPILQDFDARKAD